MKKISWLILIILCFQQSNAQDKIYIGLKAAPNVGWLQPNSGDLESSANKLGFTYGLITDFSFSENYSFGTGIDVSHHGGEIKYKNIVATEEGTTTEAYNLQYIQIPLTLKMRTKEIGYFTYYGQFGLGASFLLSASADVEFETGSAKVSEKDVNVYDDLRPFKASLIIGVGTEYNVSGSTNILIGLSFNNGFLNPLKGNVFSVENNALTKGDKKKVNTNYISLNLGVFF